MLQTNKGVEAPENPAKLNIKGESRLASWLSTLLIQYMAGKCQKGCALKASS